jgi:hypothetical protein
MIITVACCCCWVEHVTRIMHHTPMFVPLQCPRVLARRNNHGFPIKVRLKGIIFYLIIGFLWEVATGPSAIPRLLDLEIS